ncbi:CDGSH iron-sulfur domain-containing protein 2-like protein [Frankliniella fusca]|uniref:CDGSH iron-sulfur domain-containing protein 2 homologue n=1 Tax=Frankliniella fusca TaxID=407009 RepID=A0AAE1HLV9_9NEOP|nr:CDGSH iron-sulfur domain-containing protein 2-like protein [Frankliniella fusca]
MEVMSNLVTQNIPNYLSSLPVPKSIGGWFRLGFRDWVSLVPLGAVIGGLTYMSYLAFCPCGRVCKIHLNEKIEKNNPKVVHSVDVEDLGETSAFCRCWKSKTFPKCDGSHNEHNETTGDNVGPLVVKKKK